MSQTLECGLPQKFPTYRPTLGENKLLKLESGNGSWYCNYCKAHRGLCSGAVVKDHKAVQCDNCEMWVHNGCSFITKTKYETLQNANCTWICQKCEFFNLSDSLFVDQFNLENQNKFDPLTKEKKTGSSSFDTSKTTFISGLKLVSMSIDSIKGKKLELLAFFCSCCGYSRNIN